MSVKSFGWYRLVYKLCALWLMSISIAVNATDRIDANHPNYIRTVPSILINGQVISGTTVFEYLGKLVEGKKQQEERVNEGQNTEKDQGQCRINEDGELEGWCGSGSNVEYSTITEDNDDFTKKNHKIDTNLSFLDGASEISLQGQVQHMEKQDNQLSGKRQQFDNDYERLQRERGEVGNGMARK